MHLESIHCNSTILSPQPVQLFRERERERETTVPLCAVILFMEYRGPGTDWEISTLLYDMPIGRRFCRSRLMR